MSEIKLEGVKFKNHAFFSNLELKFDGTMTYLIGMNGSGKTTIIEAIWLAIEGVAQKGKDCIIGERWKFIKSGAKSMDVEIALIDESKNNAKIIIKRHITKTASKLTFTAPDGYPISHEWLKELLSVSFLSAKHFTQKNKKEQALLLGINTDKFDKQLADLKIERQIVNREYSKISEPEPLEKVERVDIESLNTEKREAQTAFDEKYKLNQEHNDKINKRQEKARADLLTECNEFNARQKKLADRLEIISNANKTLIEYGYNGSEVKNWMDSLPIVQPLWNWNILVKDILDPKDMSDYIKEPPDKSAIEAIEQKISDAYETNQKADQYTLYLKAIQNRKDKKAEIESLDAKRKTIISERNAYIQTYELPFADLTIDEDGGLLYKDREIKEPFFSKGQLEMIVHQLYSKTNNELKVRFIDDFDLLDEENQAKLPDYLIGQGYQVIAAKVGRATSSKNVIALSEKIQTKKPEIL